MRADSIRHTASTAPRASALLTVDSELPGQLAPRPFLLDPLVVLRELIDRRHAANLGLATRRERRPLGPLDGLLLRCDIKDVVAGEQLLGLSVRAIGDNRR